MDDQKRVPNEQEFKIICEKLRDSPGGESLFIHLDNIDAKSSALLTHVSIMMAFTAAMYFHVKDEPVWPQIVLVELMVYIGITIGCLRCIMLIYPVAGDCDIDAFSKRMFNIASQRRKIYLICLSTTAAITIILIMTIVIHTIV